MQFHHLLRQTKLRTSECYLPVTDFIKAPVFTTALLQVSNETAADVEPATLVTGPSSRALVYPPPDT
jgi:hypothetical protein